MNGITVTSANASDILGDADGDGATAYYDPAANTLTLDNAQLTSSGFGAVWAQEENFTLVLKGENQITGEGDFSHSAVYSHGAMTVKGNGSLTTSGTYFGLFGNNTITIEDGASVDLTVDFSSDEQDQPYAAVRAIGGLTVDGATLNAKNNATQDAGFGTPGINTDLTAINGAKVNISSVNDHGICGDVIVSGAGTVVNASSASGEHYGIFAGQEDIFGELGGDQKGIFTISDGAVVTASGGKGAMRWKPDLSGYTDPVVAAGDSAAAEEIIGDPAGTEYQNEKYVQVRSSLEPVEGQAFWANRKSADRRQQRYGAVDQPDAGLLRRRAGNAALQAEKGGGREIRLSNKQNRQKRLRAGFVQKPQPAPAQPVSFSRRDIPSIL